MTSQFTEEELAKADYGKDFSWEARAQPEIFDPVQLELFEASFLIKFIDWWNTRSSFLCFLNPLLCYCSGHEQIDADDAYVWKKQVTNPSNEKCPQSMKGLWWLKYNHAPENLVTIFSDAEFSGTFNEEGTDGYGEWTRPLRNNWSRENAILGSIFSVWGYKESHKVVGRMNLRDGICTVHEKRGEGLQVVYRQNDDEWWKIRYRGNPGEDGEQDVKYMYKWLKVLDKDGNRTKHWDDYVKWVEKPLPHKNFGSSWFPFWAWFLTSRQVIENMIVPNRKQIVNFRKHDIPYKSGAYNTVELTKEKHS